jgi:hypothetical protein
MKLCIKNNLHLGPKQNKTLWIPVASTTPADKNQNVQAASQSTTAMIFIVEKILKIGIPILFVIFTGSFFAIGVYLQGLGNQ